MMLAVHVAFLDFAIGLIQVSLPGATCNMSHLQQVYLWHVCVVSLLGLFVVLLVCLMQGSCHVIRKDKMLGVMVVGLCLLTAGLLQSLLGFDCLMGRHAVPSYGPAFVVLSMVQCRLSGCGDVGSGTGRGGSGARTTGRGRYAISGPGRRTFLRRHLRRKPAGPDYWFQVPPDAYAISSCCVARGHGLLRFPTWRGMSRDPVDVDYCGNGNVLQGDVVFWRLLQPELGGCNTLGQLADMTFGYTFNRFLQGVPLATRA